MGAPLLGLAKSILYINQFFIFILSCLQLLIQIKEQIIDMLESDNDG